MMKWWFREASDLWWKDGMRAFDVRGWAPLPPFTTTYTFPSLWLVRSFPILLMQSPLQTSCQIPACLERRHEQPCSGLEKGQGASHHPAEFRAWRNVCDWSAIYETHWASTICPHWAFFAKWYTFPSADVFKKHCFIKKFSLSSPISTPDGVLSFRILQSRRVCSGDFWT